MNIVSSFNWKTFSIRLLPLAAILVLVGCTVPGSGGFLYGRLPAQVNVDEPDLASGLGPESQDLVAIAERMARSLVHVPEIANTAGAPKVILEPVVNETRFPINKDIFLTRMRVTLNRNARGRVSFLVREHIAALEKERELKRGGLVTGGGAAVADEFLGADYILTGRLQSISARGPRGNSDYILYSFQLLDTRTTRIVWEDFAEIKKEGLDDVVYR